MVRPWGQKGCESGGCTSRSLGYGGMCIADPHEELQGEQCLVGFGTKPPGERLSQPPWQL